MFIIRPYREGDASACADCFYEGFFSCPVDQYDRILLHDYAQVLIEKCNFTYVAETDNHQVVGFICGKYDKRFSGRWQTSMRQENITVYGAECSSSFI